MTRKKRDSIEVTTTQDRVIKRILLPEDRDPCLENHIWNVDADPGEPVRCMICGAEYKMTRRERVTLRKNLEEMARLE
jgi:hypothetical protein